MGAAQCAIVVFPLKYQLFRGQTMEIKSRSVRSN
jgi:hypothetical protein